jgi:hypothetical protein
MQESRDRAIDNCRLSFTGAVQSNSMTQSLLPDSSGFGKPIEQTQTASENLRSFVKTGSKQNPLQRIERLQANSARDALNSPSVLLSVN